MKSRGFLVVLVMAAVVVVLLWQLKPAGEENIETEKLQEKKTHLEKGVQSVNRAREMATQANLKAIQMEVFMYISEYGKTPADLQQILQTAQLKSGDKDAWGTSVRYKRISDDSFHLISAGSDREFDTSDDVVLKY